MKRLLLTLFTVAMFLSTIAQKYPTSADSLAIRISGCDTIGCTVYALDQEYATIHTSHFEVLQLEYPSYTYYVNVSRTSQLDYYIVIKENSTLLIMYPNDVRLPWLISQWRKLDDTDTVIVITPDTSEFCDLFREDNLDTIVHMINDYLWKFSSSLTDTQKIEMTAAFLQQFECLDSVVIQGINNILPWMPGTAPVLSEIAVYWKEDSIPKHIVFDIVMKNLLECGGYHRNYTKRTLMTKFIGDIKFENLCNIFDSLGLEVDYMYNSTYYSSYECDTLAAWLYDSLRAVPYINHGVWTLTPYACYCHYQTKQIMFFPRFYFVTDPNVQADWIRLKQKYRLTESGGYWVIFKVPEGQEVYWMNRFKSYPIVQYSELNGIHHM